LNWVLLEKQLWLSPQAKDSNSPVIHMCIASGQEMFSSLYDLRGIRGPQPDTKAKILHASRAASSWARI